MSADTIAARFHVSGRVQGVAFRAYTLERALALGLRGYVRNLPDGRVEVLAYGATGAVREIAEWLYEGSPSSRVERVVRAEVDPAECEELTAFRVA
jgi:acylphosphatase